MPSEIEKLVDTLLKKVYAKDKKSKLKKHGKKINKRRRTTKNKKQALNEQFNYANKLLKLNQRKVGMKPKNVYNSRRRRALNGMNPYQVDRMYANTYMGGVDPYGDFTNVYRQIEALDWIQKQQDEYNKYSNQNNS